MLDCVHFARVSSATQHTLITKLLGTIAKGTDMSFVQDMTASQVVCSAVDEPATPGAEPPLSPHFTTLPVPSTASLTPPKHTPLHVRTRFLNIVLFPNSSDIPSYDDF